MPQLTNRKLVGAMGATPTGQGTVYTSMLKVCSTNRERVARVNDSEQQKLRKATGVIDKHSRHNQWMCDQEMERVQQSLTRLNAYQKVLQEEYPVRNLVAKASFRKNPAITIKRKTVYSLIKARAEGNWTSPKDDKATSFTKVQSNPKDASGRKSDKSTNEKPSKLETIRSISPQNDKNLNRKVQFRQSSNDVILSEKIYYDLSERQTSSPDAIDIVTSANKTVPQKRNTSVSERQERADNSSGIECNNDTPRDVVDTVCTSPEPNQLLDNYAYLNAQNPESELIESEPVEIQQNINNNRDFKKSKPIRIPNKWIQQSNHDVELPINDESAFSDPKTLSDLPDDNYAIAEPEKVTPQQRQKQERIKRLQAKWRAMMEERVCNRGFDMKTLRVDIDRKLRGMDVDRQFREIKKSMLEHSLTFNQSIIRASKETFETVVMETSPK